MKDTRKFFGIALRDIKSRLRIGIGFMVAQRWAVDQAETQEIWRGSAIRYMFRTPDRSLGPGQKRGELACQIGGNAA